MSDDAGPPFSRRTALVVGVSGLALAGCRMRSPMDDDPTTTPQPVDPDVALRDQAHAAIAAQLTLVTGHLRQHSSTVDRLRAWKALHRAHLAALPGATAPTPGAASASPAPELADVLAGEAALQAQLAAFAQRAESGGFARLLASMSAAIGQRVTP